MGLHLLVVLVPRPFSWVVHYVRKLLVVARNEHQNGLTDPD
jgi:hypothetical protein